MKLFDFVAFEEVSRSVKLVMGTMPEFRIGTKDGPHEETDGVGEISRRQLLTSALGAGAITIGLTGGCRLISAGPRTFDELTVGAIGIFPSPGEKYEGELPETALRAALGKLNSEGGALGRSIVFRGAQAGTEDEAFEGYRRLASDPSVLGIILATPLGTEQIIEAAARSGVPVISTVLDLQGRGLLWPTAGTNRSIFQFHLPESWSIEALVDYCVYDRRYSSATMIFDDFLFPHSGKSFVAACNARGLKPVAVQYLGQGGAPIREQLEQLRLSRSDAVFVWADPQATAEVAIALQEMNAAFIDTPTARTSTGGQWHPHLVGSPTGMFEHDWAAAAGEAARPGSVTAGDVGSFRKGPEWLPERWGEEFAVDWERRKARRRGIRQVVDATYALVESARRTGSTDRADIVKGLESGKDFRFASTNFGFSERDHVALNTGDVAIFTLERGSPAETSPPYELGTEWDLGIMNERDMTLLVRPRLEQNMNVNSELMRAILQGGYGTQCHRSQDGILLSDCKIH